jgi:prevent-host-death family protein
LEDDMPEIGAYEAKTHLPRLLEQVQKGERFVITKHGRPVAELVPIGKRDPESIRRSLDALRRSRAALAARGVRLSDLLDQGQSVRDLAHEEHRY